MKLSTLIGSLSVAAAGLFVMPVAVNAQTRAKTENAPNRDRSYGGVGSNATSQNNGFSSIQTPNANAAKALEIVYEHQLRKPEPGEIYYEPTSFEALMVRHRQLYPDFVAERETIHGAVYPMAYRDDPALRPIVQRMSPDRNTLDVFYVTDLNHGKGGKENISDADNHLSAIQGTVAWYRHTKNEASLDFSKKDVVQKKYYRQRPIYYVGENDQPALVNLMYGHFDENPNLKIGSLSYYPELESKDPAMQTIQVMEDDENLVIWTAPDTTQYDMRAHMNGMLIVKSYKKHAEDIGFDKDDLVTTAFAVWNGTPLDEPGVEISLVFNHQTGQVGVNSRYHPFRTSPDTFEEVSETFHEKDVNGAVEKIEKLFYANARQPAYPAMSDDPTFGAMFELNKLWNDKGIYYPGQKKTTAPHVQQAQKEQAQEVTRGRSSRVLVAPGYTPPTP